MSSGIALGTPPTPGAGSDARAGPLEPELERERGGIEAGRCPERHVLARPVQLQAGARRGGRRACFVRRARRVARGVDRRDDVVVGRAAGHAAVGQRRTGHEDPAVQREAGGRNAGRRRPIDVVAGEVDLAVRAPREPDVPGPRRRDQVLRRVRCGGVGADGEARDPRGPGGERAGVAAAGCVGGGGTGSLVHVPETDEACRRADLGVHRRLDLALRARAAPDACLVDLTLEEPRGHACGGERRADSGRGGHRGVRRRVDRERLVEVPVEVEVPRRAVIGGRGVVPHVLR